MMLASLEGAPGNVAAQKAEIDGRLRQINRALKTLDQTSQNHQTGNIPLLYVQDSPNKDFFRGSSRIG